MKIQTLLVLLISLLFLTQVAISQDAQQFVLNGSGARAAGMGNAFTGVSDDATAISWNSAGLTQLYSPEASVIARFGFGSMTADYQDINFDITTGSSFQLNFASLVFPFAVGKLNVVGGIAYRRVLDFTNEFEINAEAFGLSQMIKTENKGGIDAISPSVGIQLTDMVSAGATVNILTGSTDYKSEESGDLGNSSNEFKEEYSGVGIDIGILVKPSQQFQIGANLNLPQSITVKETNGVEYEYKIKVPFFFSIGAAIRASDNLTIAADYRARNWSSAKLEFEGMEDEVELGAENANSIHVGLEYLAQAGKSVVPLRVGFYTLPTPGVDENDDQITFSAITAGAGVILGTVILDASFEYIFGSYVGDEENDQNVDYSISDFRVTIGGTVHFGKK